MNALEKYKSFVTNSTDMALARYLLIVHGASGAGKTFMAATASEFYPTNVGEKKVELSDMGWISTDQGATKGLAESKLHVPHEIDFNRLRSHFGSNPVDAMNAALDIAIELPAQTIVWDTGSRWDEMLNVHYQQPSQQHLWTSKKGELDGQAFYRLILGAHQLCLDKMKQMNKNLILLFHTQAMFDDLNKVGDAAERNSRAEKAVGDADLKLQVTGKARDMYPKDADLVLALRALTPPGAKEVKRVVYTQGQQGFQAKSRWQRSLAATEEPHLGRMLAKVRANISAV